MREWLDALVPPQPVAFWRETRKLTARRMRIGCLFGMAFRFPMLLAWFVSRGSNGASYEVDPMLELLVLGAFVTGYLALGLRGVVRHLGGIVVGGFLLLGGLIAIGLLSTSGPADPGYHLYVIRNVFVILGTGLFSPFPGLWVFGLGAIPVGTQLWASMAFPLAEQVYPLLSAITALLIATVGSEVRFSLRVREFAARRSMESLAGKRRTAIRAVSGDLTEPLHQLVATCDRLEADGAPESTRAGARELEVAARRAHRMVVSVVEAASETPLRAPVPMEIGPLFGELLLGFGPEPEVRQVRCVVDPQPGLVVEGNPVALRQGFRHLLGALLERTPAGGRIDVVAFREGATAEVVIRSPQATALSALERELLATTTETSLWEGGAKELSLSLARSFLAALEATIEVREREARRGIHVAVSFPLSVPTPAEVAS